MIGNKRHIKFLPAVPVLFLKDEPTIYIKLRKEGAFIPQNAQPTSLFYSNLGHPDYSNASNGEHSPLSQPSKKILKSFEANKISIDKNYDLERILTNVHIRLDSALNQFMKQNNADNRSQKGLSDKTNGNVSPKPQENAALSDLAPAHIDVSENSYTKGRTQTANQCVHEFTRPNTGRKNTWHNSLRFSPNLSRAEFANAINFCIKPPIGKHFSPIEHLWPESSVEQGLEKLFSLESIGIEENQLSDYDHHHIEKFKRSIELKDGHYYVDLPFEEALITKVPNHYKICAAVAHRVYAKLDKQGLREVYNNVFWEQEQSHIIERIPSDVDPYSLIWLPHRPVIKTEEQVTTKIRPVFNASLKTAGFPSLNEASYPGTNLLNDLLALMIKFRSQNHTIIADIEKAFLQIRLRTVQDRNKFCFLVKVGHQLLPFRYRSLLFGYVSSPFILNLIIQHHAQQYTNDLASQLLKDYLYVDNLIYSHSCPSLLAATCLETFNRLSQAGFNLRGWNSNSHEVKEFFNLNNLELSNNKIEKVLGYLYDTCADTLALTPSKIKGSASTKREILSEISSVYDPLGIFSPLIIKGKILIKHLWQLKLGWDEKIPSHLQKQWANIAVSLQQAPTLAFARQAFNTDEVHTLVIFADASKSAFGIAIYAVSDKSSYLVFCKTKVSPSQEKSLPQLELLSAFLALKCVSNILSMFKFSLKSIKILMDSQVALSWIIAPTAKIKSIFVKNRCHDISQMREKIKENYRVDPSFSYVPTKDNIADLLTRGVHFREFNLMFNTFLKGPSWLVSQNFPTGNLGSLSDSTAGQVLSTIACNPAIFPASDSLLNIKKFSSLSSLLGTLTRVFQAVSKFAKKDPATYEPALEAKRYIIKLIQAQHYPMVLKFLLGHTQDKPDIIIKANLFLDKHSIIRSAGRLSKSPDFTFEINNPILLPRNSHFTDLVIWDAHTKCLHLSVGPTLLKVKTSGFHIPRGRQTVKSVISSCALCKKFNSLPFRYPAPTALPQHRVNFSYPFEHVGIDFTGSIVIKGADGHKIDKSYIIIYSCMNTRGIHLDLLPSMDTKQFVLSFIRFSNLFGTPLVIYSDNAKSFTKGVQLIESALQTDLFRTKFVNQAIKHIRIPVYSAWYGAIYERLIGVVKRCLHKTIGRHRLTYFEMMTVISDIQEVVNSRPLTYISSERELLPLTPNHFLKVRTHPSLIFNVDPVSEPLPDDEDTSLLDSLEIRDRMFLHFRNVWTQEYLQSLRDTPIQDNDWSNKIAHNDIVLIKTPNKTRPFWLLGRVDQTVPGHDGIIRAAYINRSDGSRGLHSIKHLYPLELKANHEKPTEAALESEAPEEMDFNYLAQLNQVPIDEIFTRGTELGDDILECI